MERGWFLNFGQSREGVVCESSDASVLNHYSNFEIFVKGHQAVEVMLDRRIFER